MTTGDGRGEGHFALEAARSQPSTDPVSELVRPNHHWLDAPATPFTRWLEKYRFVFFVGIALLILVQFNGQWRIGLDSSLYRGVAESLYEGRGYTFAGRPQTLVYPGLPVLLAASHKLTGSNSIVPVLLLFNVLTVLTVAGVYHLIRLRYPLWIAVVVMCGVGLNSRFVQQAQEVMTDAPFLFGCVTALLAWELLGTARTRAQYAGSIAMLLAGLFIAATMRPTFWVLATAWGLVIVCRAIRHRDRRSWIGLGALAVVLLAFAASDPRVRGMNVLKGGYEQQFLNSFSALQTRLANDGVRLFRREIPEAFFSEPLWLFGLPMCLLILGGCAIVVRRQPLWGLQVFILTAIMLMMSDVPRYYLMVLPTMWLGYVLALLWLTQRLPLWARDWTLFTAFGLANCINIVINLSLFREQHVGEFAQSYNKGDYQPLVELAGVIRERVQPHESIIGPYGQVLSYISGRQVLNGKLMGFETNAVSKYPQLIANANPRYMVGPSSAYKMKDEVLGRAILRGVVVPGKLVTQTDRFWISDASVIVPATDWKKLPIVPVRPQSDRPPRPTISPEELARRELKAARQRKQIRAEREARKAYNERKARKLRRQQQQQSPTPATQPTTEPTKQPATLPTAEVGVSLSHLGVMTFFASNASSQ